MAPSILFRNGTILQHTGNDQIDVLRETDMLVVDGRIERIDKHIAPADGCEVVDCTERIVCPGFVDTHHHMWQTQLKGRHSDDTLLDYTPRGNMQCFNYQPADVFWGQLAGCLESIDAGTTTVVDHAHMTYSTDHALAGLSATITSGIRSVFCYGIIPRLKRWDTQLEPEPEPIPEWAVDQLKELASRQPFGDGRVGIGLAFDMLTLPREQVVGLYQTARKAGVKTITSHWRRNNAAGGDESVPDILYGSSLLGPDILLSHATGSTETEFARLKAAGAYVSCTPATESQMAHGEIVGFRPDVNGSLGADCHSANSTSMIHAMQVGLAVARSHRNNRVLETGKFPRRVEPSTLHAFNLATICGARAIGMQEQIGSLAVGKRADVLVFRTDSPAMTCAAELDPLVAVVRHASGHELETVVVDGVFRKKEGRLQNSHLETGLGHWAERPDVEAAAAGGQLAWRTVRQELLRSGKAIERRMQHCDRGQAMQTVLQRWGVPEGVDVFA